ncbi:hypothetical protein COO60DRAFT_1204479 [Scenedesmus sp. NREL 46B-D3]|nr:hypothetical protein COO60DRAFT_1204479 [Scenedesmus sp. NREL 46B-D3]
MVTTHNLGVHGRKCLHPFSHTTLQIKSASMLRTQRLRTSSSSSRTRSSTPEQQQTSDAPGGMALNEDMLSQLRAAQEEAARLKTELAQLQQKGSGDVVDSKPQRTDSIDNRELPWAPGKRTAWLSEADVDFFTGGGATEASTAGPSAEAQATVTKRLLLGGAVTLGLLAFAMVPTKELRLKPQKPLYFYVVQLLSAQAQLTQCGTLIEDAQWDNLRLILPRIRSSPTNAESALYDVVALLDAPVAAKAEPLAAEFLEYLDAMDYNKYFDAMPTRTISGTENAEFVKFSSAALKAAQGKLAAFLALVPPQDMAAARQQADAQAE